MHAISSFSGKVSVSTDHGKSESSVVSLLCSGFGLHQEEVHQAPYCKKGKLCSRLMLHLSSNQLNLMQKTKRYPKTYFFFAKFGKEHVRTITASCRISRV